jgi:hypothetical protein
LRRDRAKLAHEIAGGVAADLKFTTDHVIDISPVSDKIDVVVSRCECIA